MKEKLEAIKNWLNNSSDWLQTCKANRHLSSFDPKIGTIIREFPAAIEIIKGLMEEIESNNKQ